MTEEGKALLAIAKWLAESERTRKIGNELEAVGFFDKPEEEGEAMVIHRNFCSPELRGGVVCRLLCEEGNLRALALTHCTDCGSFLDNVDDNGVIHMSGYCGDCEGFDPEAETTNASMSAGGNPGAAETIQYEGHDGADEPSYPDACVCPACGDDSDIHVVTPALRRCRSCRFEFEVEPIGG